MSATIWTTYELATGQVGTLFYGTAPRAGEYDSATHGVLAGTVRYDTQYVDVGDPATPTVRDKPPFPGQIDKSTVVADGIDAVTLSALPQPTQVVVTDDTTGVATTYDVPDGVLEITFDAPGPYTLRATAWPYLDGAFSVTAT